MPQQPSDDDVARAFVRRMKGAGMQDTSVTTDKEYAERFSSAKRRKLEEEADEVDLNKEVMIDGYGSLTLGQIQRRMAKMLADAAEEAQQEPPSFRTLNNGVLIAMYKTLRDHNATNDMFLKEADSTKIQVRALPSGHYRFFDLKSKLQGLYTKDGEHKSGDLRLSDEKAKDLIKNLKESETVLKEEEIEYVFGPESIKKFPDPAVRKEMCGNMERRGLPVQWVVRGGKGRCELLPNATRASLPRHLRENSSKENKQ